MSRVAAILQGLTILACQAPALAWANNGLNLIGFGAESVGMGGADIAVSSDTSALNTNPAGIARLGSMAFDVYSTIAFPLDVAHADRFGNDHKVDNDFIALGGFGLSTPLGATGLVAGIGFFAQGGAGNDPVDRAESSQIHEIREGHATQTRRLHTDRA